MRHRLLVCLSLSGCFAVAQDRATSTRSELNVEPDANNHVAQALAGEWQSDAELWKRLGTGKAPAAFALRVDHAVLAGAPPAIVEHLRGRRIYTAGTMTAKDKEQAFVLLESSGNPELFVFSPKSPDPVRGAERLRVALARGATPAGDLLFVADAAAARAFAAFTRVAKTPAKLQPEAALTEMTRLLEAGKFVEFLESWCLPDDVTRMVADRGSLEEAAKRLGAKKSKELLEALQVAAKLQPTLSEAGDEAVFAGEGLRKQLRLKCLDGRWYLCNH
jgi:hypothetical protein